MYKLVFLPCFISFKETLRELEWNMLTIGMRQLRTASILVKFHVTSSELGWTLISSSIVNPSKSQLHLKFKESLLIRIQVEELHFSHEGKK